MILHPFNTHRASRYWHAPKPASIFQVGIEWTREKPAEESLDSDSASLPPVAFLEAALFLAKEPLSSRKLTQLAGLPEKTKTRQLLNELNKRYEKDQSAFYIAEVADGFQLCTRPKWATWLLRMQGVPQTVRLSGPVMETLTVIAYRQPVQRAEVERIRGVQCNDLIRQLLDQDLVKIVGRSDELGRPFLYGTTAKFLRLFGLSNIGDLPPLASAS